MVVPVLTWTFVATVLRDPREVVYAFIGVRRLSPVLNVAGVRRLAEASYAPAVVVGLVACLLRLRRIFATS